MANTRRLDEEVARLLEAEPEVLAFLPELLADLDGLGSSPDRIAELLSSHGLQAGSRVLDLGCGMGAVAVRLAASLEVEVLGVDAFAPFVEIAAERAATRGVGDRCRFEVGDLRRWLDPDPPFDLLVLASVGPILGSVRETLRACAKAVRGGGWVVIEDCVLAPGVSSPPPGYEGYQGLDATRAAMVAAGLELVDEVLLSPEAVQEANRRNNEAIRHRARRLMRRRPDVASAIRRYVERQEAECQRLETYTRDGIWLLRKRSS